MQYQNNLLAGKVAVITGASRGIGAAAARSFAAAGAAVVLAARDAQSLAALAHEITEAGGRALAVPTDVTDPAAVEHLVGQATAAFGRLDVAFNNAGEGHQPTPLADLSIEAFDLAVRVNPRGVFLAMKYEIPAMLAGGGGAIVNMSSTAGLNGVRGLSGYVAAKHAVIGLTRSAALEYAPRQIRVNAVAPGPIETERIARLSDDARAPIIHAVPLGRIGRAEEVAALTVWLCSDQAAFLTGATIPIDGGRLAGAV
jgi:NAD(P)-dependent dehydrogenase (short-subunit alcohol dehydrogenase family)